MLFKESCIRNFISGTKENVVFMFTALNVLAFIWQNLYALLFVYEGDSFTDCRSETMGRSEKQTEDSTTSSSPTSSGYQRYFDFIHVEP